MKTPRKTTSDGELVLLSEVLLRLTIAGHGDNMVVVSALSNARDCTQVWI